jgi:hypothetical protein
VCAGWLVRLGSRGHFVRTGSELKAQAAGNRDKRIYRQDAKAQRREAMMGNEIFILRPPSPFILSPPSLLRFDAITPKPKAKADRRGNGCWPIPILRVIVRQIQSHELSSRRRMILLLLGEKAGLREGVSPNRSHAGIQGEIILGWTIGAIPLAKNNFCRIIKP